jgi:hypothetical protein
MTINVRYLSEDAIEKDAELLLSEYEDTIGEPIRLPVPVTDITVHHLALRLGFDDLHQTLNRPMPRGQPDILGAIWVDERLVLIDRHLDPKSNPPMMGRFRFSVAHEVGPGASTGHRCEGSRSGIPVRRSIGADCDLSCQPEE